jgi:hypothetical protein
MFFTLLVPASCATKDETEPFVCKPAEYYLKTYTILLGDFGTFERESFQAWFSVFLVVFFSFMVVVVLLSKQNAMLWGFAQLMLSILTSSPFSAYRCPDCYRLRFL